MTSSPIRVCPTRSARRDLGAAACLLLLAALGAQAHEPGEDAIPETPGWRLGAAIAALGVDADERWPARTWPGVLIDGTSPRDMRSAPRVEHATLDLAARFGQNLGAHAAVGWHDRDAAHAEAARLQARWVRATDRLELTAGRDAVRMGSVIDAAGHFDLFSQMPLAKRAVTNGMWTDDGATAAWRGETTWGLRGVEIGGWRGRAFPGSAKSDVVPTLQLSAGWGNLDAQLFAAHLQPDGRGAVVQTAGDEGHLHSPPDCTRSLVDLVCFDGRSNVFGASLRWENADGNLVMSVAGLARRERGQIYSQSGEADYRAELSGVWADVAWQPRASWTIALRAERLVPRNDLHGIGAALLAREANLTGGDAVKRVTAALLRQFDWGLQLAIEAGQERRAALDTRHAALRVIWRNPRLLGGSPW